MHFATCESQCDILLRVQLQASGVKILVDPWLEGKLVFAWQDWFFTGEKPGLKRGIEVDIDAIVRDVDFILLAQSLDDHTHRPTLKVLPKHIPIVAGPEAAKIARELGFETVHAIDHGEKVRVFCTPVS